MRWIKADDKRPDPKPDIKYVCRNVTNHSDTRWLYWNDIPTYFEWLDESTPSPGDASILYDALKEIETTLGTISFSSHNQMKEAIEGGLNLVQESLSAYNSTEGQSQTGEDQDELWRMLKTEFHQMITWEAARYHKDSDKKLEELKSKYHITRKQ